MRERLPDELDRLDVRRALIVTGRSLTTDTPVIREIEALLGDSFAGTFSGIQQHAPARTIREAVRLALELGIDGLVSVGGGSPIDAGKAMVRELEAADQGRLPHLAVPTTLSAAEFSHLVGFSDDTTGAKTGFADPWVTPPVVILDPWVTLHTPMELWLSSGVRALDHAVETLYSPGLHPVNDVLALEAIWKLFQFLPLSKVRPADLQVRLSCQLAAWMSFFAPASVKLGLSHRLGRLTGASYGVPHGITSCIFLPLVMEARAEQEAGRLAPIARKLGLAGEAMDDLEAALLAAQGTAALIERLGLPQRLRDVGVPRRALTVIADQAGKDFPDNPGIEQILERAW